MMNKRNFFFVTGAIVASVILLASFTFANKIFKAENSAMDENKGIEILFADNYISYVIEKDTTMSFNIFGIQKIDKKAPSITDEISDISFNNKDINIVNFNLDAGLINDGYQLFNFIIDVEILSNSIEKDNELTLYFKNGQAKSFNIGKIILQNDLIYEKDDISPSGNYTVGYPKPSLDVSLINNTNDIIELKMVEDLSKNMNYEFTDNINLNNKEPQNLLIPSFNLKKEYDFYTVTPIVSYSTKGNSYSFNMPGVMFGTLMSDQEKIQMIIED